MNKFIIKQTIEVKNFYLVDSATTSSKLNFVPHFSSSAYLNNDIPHLISVSILLKLVTTE